MMTEVNKQAQPVQEPKADEPKKAEAALDEKQLDKVTGGSLYQACVKGEHIKTGTITT